MEVRWHLRFARVREMRFLVKPHLAPNVEDAAFIAGDWRVAWDRAHEAEGYVVAVATRVPEEDG